MKQYIYSSISFAIPCFNSANTIEAVIDEIDSVMAQRSSIAYDITCVVDGSPDNVFEVLYRMSIQRPNLRVISLAKNAGKHAALLAAFKYVAGDVVVTLDDDGECPLPELWKLVEPLCQGYDMALAHYGWRPYQP